MEPRKSSKKKLSGANLRSPIVKRSTQAPVSMQGWLWKQGSDGFMRWKRRWFVLSDFCLFYYKGPEEEKILGSILLPSYSITPCLNEMKVMKNFAFKAEHQNMRTYYFAADSKESLQQWLNTMSLATVLQHESNYDDHLDSSHCSDSHNTSTANEDEDSGFTSYHSRRYVGSPQDGNSPLNGSFTSDSLQHSEERYRDPSSDLSRTGHERNGDVYLGNSEKYPVVYGGHTHYYKNPKPRLHSYANAPPKPRRAGNDSYNPVIDASQMEQPPYNNGAGYPVEEYPKVQDHYRSSEYMVNNKNAQQNFAANEQFLQNKSRREENPGQGTRNPYHGGQHTNNYEIVQERHEHPGKQQDDPNVKFYSVDNQERRHHSGKQQQPNAKLYSIDSQERKANQSVVDEQHKEPNFQDEYDPAILREKGQRLFHAQRPHSANFLESDGFERHKQMEGPYNHEELFRRKNKENAPRPKSSTEQYNSHPEYWIESLGVSHQHPPPHTPHTPSNPHDWNIPIQVTQKNELSRSGNLTEEKNDWYSGDPIQYQGHPHGDYYSDAKYVTSVEMISPAIANQTRGGTLRDSQFLRSASARLPSSASASHLHGLEGLPTYSQDDLAENDPKHQQQREESMKRLLEWKQRMLQSPLTKKHQQKVMLQEPDRENKKKSPSEEYHRPQNTSKQVTGQDAGSEKQVPSKSQMEIPGYLKNGQEWFEPNIKQGEIPSSVQTTSEHKNSRLYRDPAFDRLVQQPPSSTHSSLRHSGEGKPNILLLNHYRSSYSSDDEESGSGSFKGYYLSQTQPRRRSKSDSLSETANITDSELHMRAKAQTLQLNKTIQQTEVLNGNNIRLSMSAGDLLGKTHEELILLLIQLRRTQARLQKAIDSCRVELEGEKKLMQIDIKNREAHSKKVEELSLQLADYTKRFDLNKPLVNLVDNMVKLGSLYGGSEHPTSTQYDLNHIPPDQYVTPQKMIQYARCLQAQEDENEWSQLFQEQISIQNKLQHLYQLDRSLQDESVILSNLQQDKEMLERALAGIQSKAEENRNNVAEKERLLKQQQLVEKELGKVQMQLINTAKKLEETASENSKIEHEIILLRQKIQQILKKTSNCNNVVYTEDAETAQLKLQLEEELAHVHNVMEELSKRRHEITGAVQQLKDNESAKREIRPSPTGVSGSAALPGRKHPRSTYLETDLDTLETKDAVDTMFLEDSIQLPVIQPRRSQIPLYVNSNGMDNKTKDHLSGGTLLAYLPDQKEIEEFMEEHELYSCQDINEADDRMKRFYGILPRDKPSEVKTVRIVKRESERRNKSKDRGRKVINDEQQSLSRVVEEPDSIIIDDFDYLDDIQLNDFQRSMSLPRNYGRTNYLPPQPPDSLCLSSSANTSVSSTPSTSSSKVIPNVPYYYRTPSLSPLENFSSAHERLFGNSPIFATAIMGNPESTTNNNPLATPVFQSEAARQIVAETAQQFISTIINKDDNENQGELRLILGTPLQQAGSLKRHKRRHYTISSSQPLVLEACSPKLVHARSRDDLDMERCLRSANTPDVVKSTIKKSENFDESTIDRELGLPQKIVIPERYVEHEQEEELTAEEKLHRLQKAESIRKMLSETTTYGDLSESEIANASETLKKKFEQEKKQREQLLSLNQLLAQEVKERSKAVAAHTTTPRAIPSASYIS